MEEPYRRRPSHGERASRPAGRGYPGGRTRQRSRMSLIAGIGLPTALVLGVIAFLPGLTGGAQGAPAQDTVAGVAAAVTGAANAGAGTMPVTQSQAGAMLDPRGKHAAARAR